MALSAKQRPASAAFVRSYAREVQLYCFEFTAQTTPADLVQDEAIVSSTPTRDSDGVYSVLLAHRYKRIYGFANCEKGAAGWQAQVTDVVDGGTADNSLKVRVSHASDTAANPDAKVQVFLYLVTADSA